MIMIVAHVGLKIGNAYNSDNDMAVLLQLCCCRGLSTGLLPTGPRLTNAGFI